MLGLPRRGRAAVRGALAITLASLLTAGLVACDDLAAAFRPGTFEPPPAVPDPGSESPPDPVAGFAVPLWLQVPRTLTLERSGPHLVTWSLAGDPDVGVRLMAPTTVRAPRTAPAPADLHAYLRGLRPLGVRITGDRAIEIDGVLAHRFTLRAQRAVRDGLGCWSARAEDCFSLSPGLTLEMTTFAVGGRPVAVWSRTWASRSDSEVSAALHRLLGTVSFERWGRSGQHRAHASANVPEGR